MVSLYVRISKDERQRYIPANPRKEIDEGTYCLRYTVKERQPDGPLKSRRIWQAVGDCLTMAIVFRNRKEEALLACDGIIDSKPELVTKPADAKSALTHLHELFMEQKRLTKKQDGNRLDKETISAYEQHTDEFLQVAKKTYAEQVTGMDLRRYMAALEEQGKSHRTICNNYTDRAGARSSVLRVLAKGWSA